MCWTALLSCIECYWDLCPEEFQWRWPNLLMILRLPGPGSANWWLRHDKELKRNLEKSVMTMKNWTCHFLAGVGSFYSHQMVKFSFKLSYYQTFCTLSVLVQRYILGLDSNLLGSNLPFPHDLCAIKGIAVPPVWSHTFCWHPQLSM